jgi:hypothetical protein
LSERKEKRMMKSIATILAALLILPFPCVAWGAFKCGSTWVKRGDSTTAVLAKCGPPELRESRVSDSVTRRTVPGKKDTKADRKVETWIYNFGNKKSVRVLTFEGGILKSIELAGHGYKPKGQP